MCVFMKNEALGKKPNPESVSHAVKYCYHLKSIMPRLQEFEEDMQICFKWKTAYEGGMTLQSNKLLFEWACCMWNIGAAESYMGSTAERATEEGIKTANKHFQAAAGYFDLLLQEDLPSTLKNNILPCISTESLRMAKHLMLAQAQLCFYEKAVKDRKTGNMKPSIIAKIALQTSKFYAQTSTDCIDPALSRVLDSSWGALCGFQSKCFEG